MKAGLIVGLVAAIAVASSASEAKAECLPVAERAAFEAALEARFAASGMSMERLYDHAANRLGYGWTGGHGARSHAHLATVIANRLTGVANDTDARDQQLAMVTDEAGNLPYRHVEMNPLQLLEAWDTDSRARIRSVAGVRTMAHALDGPNLDLGTVLREFWFNHFNVSAQSAMWATPDYQRSIRAAQCGTFGELLETTAKHPAMLLYLDNRRSIKDSINENYSREVIELHTFGDDEFVHYDQQDVVGVANALTGWTLGLGRAANGPRFKFVPANHEPSQIDLFDGALVLAPIQQPAAQIQRGEAVLDFLAEHEATRENVCRKLALRLVGAAPAPLVNSCAHDSVWGTGGDLGAMYRHILTSPQMWAPGRWRRQWKNPLELVASAHRAVRRPTAPSYAETQTALAATAAMGQRLGFVPPPTGYPDGKQAWLGAGRLVQWQQFVFENVQTNRVRMSFDGAIIKGNALETRYQQWMNEQDDPLDPLPLHGLIDDTSVALALPEAFALRYSAIRKAARRPDTRTASGKVLPLRTTVHAILVSKSFMHK